MRQSLPLRVRLTFSVVMLATLLAALDQTIVATALPQIVNDLEGFSQLSWVVTAYLVAATVTIPLYGKLSDLYGRRRLFVIAVSLFLLGSALCGLAQSMGQLIAFRAVQGLGAGGLLPLAQATVGDLFSPRERGRYQGYVAAMWGVAAVAGPLLGGLLTDVASWRWIFLVNLPLGALIIAVVMRTMPRHVVTGSQQIDVAGATTLAAGITALLLAFAWGGQEHPWGSAQVVGAAAGGALLLCLFVLIERRAAEPLLPLHLFRMRTFAIAVAANVAIGGIIFAITIYTPVYLQGALEETATLSGTVLIALSAGWVLSSAWTGRAISRTGRYRSVMLAGSAIVVVGACGLVLIDSTPSVGGVTVALAVTGVGMGSLAQTYVLATQNAVPHAHLGTATAALQFFRTIGGSVAVAGLGALLAARVSTELNERLGDAAGRIDRDLLLQGGGDVPPGLADHARAALAASTHWAFLAVLVLGVALLVLASLLKELPLHDGAGTEPAPADVSAAH